MSKFLVVLIEGLPGCGKNFMCSKLHQEIQRAQCFHAEYHDIDTFSQSVLENDNMTFARKITAIRTAIKNALNDPTVCYILCGVSGVLHPTTSKFNSYLPASKAYEYIKLWLDISPSYQDFTDAIKALKPKIPSQYWSNAAELLESSRRAVLREMKHDELDVWKNMPEDLKSEDIFYSLEVPKKPLTNDEFQRFFRMPLSELIKQQVPNTKGKLFSVYVKGMMLQLMEEGYLENKSRCIEELGFTAVPILNKEDNLFHAVLSAYILHGFDTKCKM